jgi:D-alanyl-D-alanine carboxypeptidase (penicillin-binding protein 5/6)
MARNTSHVSWKWAVRGLIAAAVVSAVGWSSALHAANQSVQGAKKPDELAFDGDAPTAILIEASSGSVLFEKNADELRAPSSMMKLMTAEVVFHALEEGKIKLTDEFRISENAWRHGGAPSGTSTMFAAINSKVDVDDLLHGAIIQSGNDACIALAEGMAGNDCSARRSSPGTRSGSRTAIRCSTRWKAPTG